MNLLDHFRPPLGARRRWRGFYTAWAAFIAADVNQRLPDGYFAETDVRLGIESGAEVVQVRVCEDRERLPLAGVVALATPADKDRAERRNEFLTRCAAYLRQGIGLVVVDAATQRPADLHGELLGRFGVQGAAPGALYAAAYHPFSNAGETSLETWQEPLAVGRPLPTMPLCLRGGLSVPVELGTAYARACRELRVLS
jgi:hypothetical protein